VPSKPRGIYLEPNLVDSQAFLKLNGIAIQVYLLFLKRRVKKNGSSKIMEKLFLLTQKL
jgi:hypothetical protein